MKLYEVIQHQYENFLDMEKNPSGNSLRMCVNMCGHRVCVCMRERERALTYPSNADVTRNMDPISVIWGEN